MFKVPNSHSTRLVIFGWNCKLFHGETNHSAFPSCEAHLTICKGTIDYGLNYGKGREVEDLVGFSDSDHGGDKVGGKSTGGMIFYLGRNAISWQSQKQKTVALSSCEAEFMAATATACQPFGLGIL